MNIADGSIEGFVTSGALIVIGFLVLSLREAIAERVSAMQNAFFKKDVTSVGSLRQWYVVFGVVLVLLGVVLAVVNLSAA